MPAIKKKKSAAPKAKTGPISPSKSTPELKCVDCRDGERMPDAITFAKADISAQLFIDCHYCKRRLEWKVASRIAGITLRTSAMAERANR